ncbi:MAG: HyaD/HybD family hydrogenase maturation endopeptidase [Gammaproteobacteria bacterium]|nr:HyaD/HybD family hydrogenase maturation endopeptidase [Gammaproteobacteria bacterium]MCW8983676.1 HyaD/HybD family hydrogenase maturation endopeptidase [Gammaproteobacteria bacterium]
MTVLILGIGNNLLTDEGAGIHAIRYLEKHHPDSKGVRYVDGGTIGFPLAGEIAQSDSLIVIDAAELNAEVGEIGFFEGESMDDYLGTQRKSSVHEVGLRDLLSTSQLLDELPANRALLGIQPKTLSWGEEPTEAVAAAIPIACQMALDLVERWSR